MCTRAHAHLLAKAVTPRASAAGYWGAVLGASLGLGGLLVLITRGTMEPVDVEPQSDFRLAAHESGGAGRAAGHRAP